MVKTGAKVRLVYDSEGHRIEVDIEEGVDGDFVDIPDPLPAGLNGTVVYMMNGGNLPTSGMAIVNWDLPSDLTKTGGAGSTMGPMIMNTAEFHKMEVLD